MRRGDLFNHAAERLAVADIAGAYLGGSAPRVDALANLLKQFSLAADQDDQVTVIGQPVGNGPTDAATGARDDGNALFDWKSPV